MAHLLKSSVLVCLALLSQVAMASPNEPDSSPSSSAEGMLSEEGSQPSPAIQSNGRGRAYIFSENRPARRGFAQMFTSNTTDPNQPARTFGQRWQQAAQNGIRNRQPRPDGPSIPADSSRVETPNTNTNRNVPDIVYRLPEPAGTFGSSVGTVNSENVQPSGPTDRRTQSQTSNSNPNRPSSSVQNSFPGVVVKPNESSGNVPPVKFFPQSNNQNGMNIPVASGGVEQPVNSENVQPSGPTDRRTQSETSNSNPNRPGSPVQNSFPVVVVKPNESSGNVPPVRFFPQSNNQNGMNIPVASGGVEPPINFVPRNQLFVPDDVSGFDRINPSNTQSSQGSSNDGGSPNLFPSQDTNTNSGSSTGSFNGGSSQQPSTGSVGSPAKGFPTNNNVFQGSGGTNQFPVVGGKTYPEIFSFSNAIQVFTLDLLATFKMGSLNNVVYSPVSISSLLSVLTLATNGISKREIEDALFPLSSSNSNDHHNKFEIILERLNHLSQGITISTSSRLFLEQSVNISGTFRNGAMKHYNCSVSLENFSNRPEQTMNRVNSWVEEQTRGKITTFVGQPFRSDTKFVAANTIYFDGKWAEPFPESSTAERDFDTGNEIIQISMMTNVIETPHYYSEELNVDVTSLAYVGSEFAMIIILPRESPREKSLMDLEKQLNSSTIESLVDKLTSKPVSISLPKMKLAMKTSLVTNLSELRIRSIFSPYTADFSSLSDMKPLFVSEFLHEAVMEVTEEGTVAAAASAVYFNRMGGQKIVNVNKPAIIFIRDMATRVPLFWTRLVKPEPVPESGQKKAPSPAKF